MTQPPPSMIDYRTPPRRKLVADDVAYWIPMFTFLGFTWVGGNWPSLYPASYVAKTIVVAIALMLLWRQYTPIRWNGWWLGVIVGVIGIFQWIGMQLLLQHFFDHFDPSPEVFNPEEQFGLGTGTLYAWYAVRIAGAVLIVPVMEELFWRDWLWRTIVAPNDFKLARIGEWDWRAFIVVSALFATVHGNWWPTAIVWAMLIGALLVYTRSLGACIVAHAVTNLLLSVYVLYTRDWSFW